MVILAVMLMLCTCMLALAQENAFVGRWNEDSELGGSITLRSDGSFEGSVMLFYEMKGFYTLNDSTTATLHPESVTVMSGMERFVSGSSTMGNALLEQLDGKQLVLSDDGTLSFFGMEMLRDESYREVDIIYDGRLEGQWELKNHAGELDQMMLYFTPDGVVYAAYDGMIYEKTYTFDGTTVVMGEGNTISAVLQEDGSLKVEFAGTYVKTKAYAEQNFAAIAGLYGEEQNGYISGYYLTPEGNLLNMYGLPGVALQWTTRESGMVMAGNRIGTHDDLGNRFYAMVEDGEMTEENWTISNSRWMRGDVISYPLLYTVEEFVALMGLDSVSNDLPNDIGGRYVVPGEEFVLVIYPDGTAMWDDMKMTVKADGNRVVIFSEEDSGYAYIMTYSPDTLTMFDGEQRTVLSRISAIDEAGADNGSYDRLFELTIDEGGVTVNGFAEGVDDVTELVIPATLRGLPVVAVSDDAFRGEEQLISVTIEEGIQSIGSNAFAYCEGLEKVILPVNMISVGEGVFSNCGVLRSVVLPAGITDIPASMFYNCRLLESVVIPDGVTTIGRNAFTNCESMEELVLPPTVNEFGHFAFMGSGIRSLFIPEGVEYFHASMIEGTSKLEKIFFPRSINVIEDETIPGDYSRHYYFDNNFISYMLDDRFSYGYGLGKVIVLDNYDAYGSEEIAYEIMSDGTARITSWFGSADALVIPSEIDGIPVTVIGEKAFAGNRSFSSLIIEEGITTIEPYAFYLTNTQTIVLPSTLKSIGDYAFNGATVSSLYIPEGVETIGTESLPTGLEEVYIPSTVTALDNRAGWHIGVGYVFEGSAGQKFATQSWVYRQFYGCETCVLVEPGEITQAEDGSILRQGMTTAEYEIATATSTPAPTPTPMPTPTPTPRPTLPPIVLTPPTTAPDQADGVPLEFCGRYSLDDNCAWGIEVTTDFWIYPNGYVYYRAECEEGVMIQHGTVMFEGSEIWDGTTVWTMKINYHHRECDYFNACTHYEYRINKYDGRITLNGTDTACMSDGEFVSSELLDVAFGTVAPTPETTPVADHVVFELPAEARSKDVPDDDPAKILLGPWHGTYYDTIYDFYFAPNGVVYGSSYDYEFEVWTHYCVGQYTVSDSAVEMTWPEGLWLPKILTFTDDPNSLLLYEEDYMNYYIRRAAE